MLRGARTWALVDTLAVHGAGAITLQHKEAAGTVLDRWAIDQDFWLRRSALLCAKRSAAFTTPTGPA
ncbi:DNA alkylation repair protein [Streptomyces sp. NPDC053086]|uniref:DNA alkylation repair protein n=1 Tax=unclassified Streptomyces TaxID=2593676 RepID=UPI0037CFF394